MKKATIPVLLNYNYPVHLITDSVVEHDFIDAKKLFDS